MLFVRSPESETRSTRNGRVRDWNEGWGQREFCWVAALADSVDGGPVWIWFQRQMGGSFGVPVPVRANLLGSIIPELQRRWVCAHIVGES